MAVQLTIEVTDISATLLAGYTKIKIYRSALETSGFDEITTSSTTVPLQIGVSDYEFIDAGGTTSHWYRYTYYDPNTPAESEFSSSFLGDYYDTNFTAANYPEEGVFTNDDRLVLDKVRSMIGDRKELTRDFVSAETGYSSISSDEYTHTLSNPKGWPVKVILDDVSYTTAANPVVNDYQFITFSGSQISTTSGTLDIWYYHFRFSDAEVMRAYNGLTPPYPLEAADVTFELAILCVAIELLSSELSGTSASSGVEVDIHEEIRINPKVGLDSRYANLKRLIAERDAIIAGIEDDTYDDDLFGVLID